MSVSVASSGGGACYHAHVSEKTTPPDSAEKADFTVPVPVMVSPGALLAAAALASTSPHGGALADELFAASNRAFDEATRRWNATHRVGREMSE